LTAVIPDRRATATNAKLLVLSYVSLEVGFLRGGQDRLLNGAVEIPGGSRRLLVSSNKHLLLSPLVRGNLPYFGEESAGDILTLLGGNHAHPGLL
jgi:hypothetical protein